MGPGGGRESVIFQTVQVEGIGLAPEEQVLFDHTFIEIGVDAAVAAIGNTVEIAVEADIHQSRDFSSRSVKAGVGNDRLSAAG